MEIQYQVQPTTSPYVCGGGGVEFRSPPCPLNFILSSTVMRRSIWIPGRMTYDDATTVRSQIVAREREAWTEAAVAEQLAAMGIPEHPELIQDTLAAVGTADPGMVIDVMVLDAAEVLVDDYEDAIDMATRESFETAAYRASLVPASKSVIEGLEKVGTSDCSKLRTEQCSICMEDLVDLTEKEHITRLPCLHHFHTDCISHWLGINHKCPLCRIPVDERGNS